MRQNKKIRNTVLSLIIILFAGLIVTNSYLFRHYRIIAQDYMRYNQKQQTQTLFIAYYDSVGHFPHSIDEVISFACRNYYYDDSEENIRSRLLLTDLLAKNKNEILYVPLYDYQTKVPVSFIFLSAGIDGKMDNKITPDDTLYLNNWWAKLNVYNYEEAVLLQKAYEITYKNWMLFRDKKQYFEYYPPYPNFPPFNMRDYLWGKKDWIIQLGPIPLGNLFDTYDEN